MQSNSLIHIPEMDIATKTDQDFLVISEAIREYSISELEQSDDLDHLVGMRTEAATLQAILAKAINSREIKMEAENNIADVRLRTERRIGKLLAALPKNAGGGDQRSEHRFHDGTSDIPTYAERGISKKLAHRWQTQAVVPDDEFEDYIAAKRENSIEITSADVYRMGRKAKRETELAEMEAAGELAPLPERVDLIHADFRDHLPHVASNSIDWIITDPPYGKEHIELYEPLAEQAARILKPGGSILAMVGQYHLPAVLDALGRHLKYHWTLAYMTPGGQSPQIFPRKVNTFWKPVLWLVKDQYDGEWIGDVASSAVNDNDKRQHDWGQSESGMMSLLRKFVQPGDTVLDPFLGGGTTGIAALQLGCQFIGIDRELENIQRTTARLAA